MLTWRHSPVTSAQWKNTGTLFMCHHFPTTITFKSDPTILRCYVCLASFRWDAWLPLDLPCIKPLRPVNITGHFFCSLPSDWGLPDFSQDAIQQFWAETSEQRWYCCSCIPSCWNQIQFVPSWVKLITSTCLKNYFLAFLTVKLLTCTFLISSCPVQRYFAPGRHFIRHLALLYSSNVSWCFWYFLLIPFPDIKTIKAFLETLLSN